MSIPRAKGARTEVKGYESGHVSCEDLVNMKIFSPSERSAIIIRYGDRVASSGVAKEAARENSAFDFPPGYRCQLFSGRLYRRDRML